EAPVDLVGSGLVDNIVVQKTFTPDQPGEFSGGSVQINTREFPESRNFNLSYSTGFNSVATFNSSPGYSGSPTDFLGFDNGKRSLPGILSSQRLGTDNGMQSRVVNALHRDWMITNGQKAIPSQKITLNYANQFNEDKRPVGLVTSLSYKYDRSYEPEQLYRKIQSFIGEDSDGGDRFLMNSDYRRTEGSENVKLSGMANLYFKPSRVTKIGFKNLYSNSLTNSSSIIEGAYINYDYTRQTIMEFDRRALFSSTLEFDTYLENLSGGRLTTRLGYNNAVRDRPDRRTTQYNRAGQSTSPQIYFDDGGNGHFFSRQSDNNYSGELDFSVRPLSGLKIKTGVSTLFKQRDFYARRFEYRNYRNRYPEEAKALPADQALAPGFIEQDLLDLEETTQNRDSYDGKQRLLAGYLSMVWTPADKLTMEVGARVEHSDQEVYIPERTSPIANVDNRDLLPAANITLNLSDRTNLRGAFSKTLARPEFREISEFRFQDFVGGQIVYGNPELDRTQIYNYDLRFEIYPDPGELLAVSAFYKKFHQPIEIFYRFTERTEVQYRNAEEADLYGIELEARKNIVPRFQIVANASYIFSETRVSKGDTGTLGVANARRPMYGQSPYTVNVTAFYAVPRSNLNLSAGYNTFGRRLVTVGVYRHNYDEYEQPFHSVNLSADYILGPATFTLRADNLLNQQSVYRQGDLVTFQYRPGMTFDFGIKYSF
ncbi:MAG: TonB-dependent receptor, partial [Balneolaceae bacterium]|nr:TonB-dependent receptor [Balneolaceae bacterium]